MVGRFIFFLALFAMATGATAEEHGGGGDKKKEVAESLVLDNLVVPVIIREEIQAYYALSISIEPKDPSKREVLAEFSHRIRDALIRDLYIILPLIFSRDEQPNIEILKGRLEKVVIKITPEDTIGLFTINSFFLSDK